MVGAPAKRIDARQESTNEWRTDSPCPHTPSNTAVERSLVFDCGHVVHLAADDAPSKEIWVTETCTRRCERKRRGKIRDGFPLQNGNANTRSPLHRKPPACSTNREARPLGWYHLSTRAGKTLRCDTAFSVRFLFCSHHIQNTG